MGVGSELRLAWAQPDLDVAPTRAVHHMGNSSLVATWLHETWVFVLDGHARVRLRTVFVGQAIFLEPDRTSIKVGSSGLKGLVAHSGTEPSLSLLYNLDGQNAGFPIRHFSQLPLPHRAATGARSMATRQ